jgi:hypothetical protein
MQENRFVKWRVSLGAGKEIPSQRQVRLQAERNRAIQTERQNRDLTRAQRAS